MNLTASGQSTSVGNAQDPANNVPVDIAAYGASQTSGSAVCVTYVPLGAMADFGAWPTVLPDPAVSCVLADVAPVATGGRVSITATTPAEYDTALGTLWNSAAYGSVRGSWVQGQHSGINQSTALTQVQLERTEAANLLPPDAQDYRDNLVYQQYSTTVSGATTWGASITRSQDRALSGLWSGKFVNTPQGFATYAPGALPAAMAPVVAGTHYSGSVNLAIERTGAQWQVQLNWYDGNFDLLTPTTSAAVTHPGGFAWQPASVTGIAPVASGGNGAAVWAAVVPVVTPLTPGDGEIAYADVHRLWSTQPAQTLAPTTFVPARQQNIVVKANRVNYANNPGFTTSTYGWWGQGGTGSSPLSWEPAVGRSVPGAAKLTATYGAGAMYPQMGTLSQTTGSAGGITTGRSGETFTLSCYVLPGPQSPNINLQAIIGGGDGGIYVPGTSTLGLMPDANGWYRLSVTTTIPPESSGAIEMLLAINPTDWTTNARDVSWWVDDVLVEQSSLLGEYFDASLPSPDYLWEGTAFESRSHYYQGLRILQYRINELVEQSLPIGVPYQILLAQPDS